MEYCDDIEMDMMSYRHDGDHPASYLYEYDRGKRRQVVCKHCGNNRLKWQYTAQGWRTFEGGVMHKCPAFGNSTANKV